MAERRSGLCAGAYPWGVDRFGSEVLACVALGSNLGDRAGFIVRACQALDALPGTALVACSALFETEPEGLVEQGQFLNAAALLRTTLTPRRLLESLLAIEQAAGRDRTCARPGGSRTLDLDLLLYGDQVICEPDLVVPHPRMHRRRFVLEPLVQIAPDLLVPTLGQTVRQLLAELPSGGRVEQHSGTGP